MAYLAVVPKVAVWVLSSPQGGRTCRFDGGLVVRLYRGGEPVGFWEASRNVIERDDLLLIIQPTA